MEELFHNIKILYYPKSALFLIVIEITIGLKDERKYPSKLIIIIKIIIIISDSIAKNGQNPETSPGDLRRLAVTQTPVKNHQLTLM